MPRIRIRGENGAETAVEVPGPGIDQRTFDRRVELGQWTVLDGPDTTDTDEVEPVEDDSDEPETPTVDTDVPRPPDAGPGSSRQAWADYATAQGVDVSDDDTRDDIKNKLDG